MIRAARRASVATAVAAATVLSGCATFSDADVAARVGDTELSQDELTDILRTQFDDPATDELDDVGSVPMQAANQVITNFILLRVLSDDLVAAGGDLPDLPEDLPLPDRVNATGAAWQAAVTPTRDRAELAEMYAAGPVESGIACTAHILVDDEATADEALDRLAAGEAFADVALELSVDPGSGSLGGVLPCASTQEFASAYIPEFVTAAFTAEVGEPVGPVATQFGFHVIVVRPFDDLSDDEIAPFATDPGATNVEFERALTTADIYVNPRYGEFDPTQGVVPLG